MAVEKPLSTSGFPSPAADYIENSLDLNGWLVRHPAATFFVRVSGNAMVGAGIFEGDILVVDRAVEAEHGRVVVAVLDGELTVRRLFRKGERIKLVAENPDCREISISPERDFSVWGVVTYVIHEP